MNTLYYTANSFENRTSTALILQVTPPTPLPPLLFSYVCPRRGLHCGDKGQRSRVIYNFGGSHSDVFSLGTINRLTPDDPYMGRTAPLTSKHCILYIYSTNISTEYFKQALYSPFFLFKMQFVS